MTMTEDRITDNLNPTEDDIREWGYDLSRSFMEQDEDLIFLHCGNIAVLLELADDADCPKGDDVRGMLTDFARCAALRTDDGLVRAVGRAGAEASSAGAFSLGWRAYVQRLIGWRVTPTPTDGARALAMAYDLLGRPHLESRLLLHVREGTRWHIRMTLMFEAAVLCTEDLWIEEDTSRFRYAGPMRVDIPL